MRKTRLMFLLVPAAAMLTFAFGTTALGQGRPESPTQRTRTGFPAGGKLPPAPATVHLPEAPGESFTALPGARRVQPPGGVVSEERILTITDGVTGKEYRVPYTAEIQAEQTADGAVHGRVAMPGPDVLQAAIDEVIPADEQAEMRKPKAQRLAEAAVRNGPR